jgi:hypothetical protein
MLNGFIFIQVQTKLAEAVLWRRKYESLLEFVDIFKNLEMGNTFQIVKYIDTYWENYAGTLKTSRYTISLLLLPSAYVARRVKIVYVTC